MARAQSSSPAGFADLPEDIAPRLAGAGVALEFREHLVERLPLGGRGSAAIEQVGFVEFGEPGKELGAVADGQPWQLFKDLRFAHDANLARRLFSRKNGLKRCGSLTQGSSFLATLGLKDTIPLGLLAGSTDGVGHLLHPLVADAGEPEFDRLGLGAGNALDEAQQGLGIGDIGEAAIAVGGGQFESVTICHGLTAWTIIEAAHCWAALSVVDWFSRVLSSFAFEDGYSQG